MAQAEFQGRCPYRNRTADMSDMAEKILSLLTARGNVCFAELNREISKLKCAGLLRWGRGRSLSFDQGCRTRTAKTAILADGVLAWILAKFCQTAVQTTTHLSFSLLSREILPKCREHRPSSL